MGTAPVVPEIKQERTVLKKAGIAVAAAAVGLLAVSPLAFAGESGKSHHAHSHGATDVNSYQENSEGLVNVSDNDVAVPINALNCDDVPVQILNILPIQAKDFAVPLTGALGILGDAKSHSDVDQDNSRNCGQGATNAGDANG
jgi:hypothetical protein